MSKQIKIKEKKEEKLGNIIDNYDMYIEYKRIHNQPYFVDKSNIINKFNKLINKNSCYVCITKPRRFGKTSIASLLVTYYSKNIDSKEIFDKLKVSKGLSSDEEEKQEEIKQYEEYQGKYHTLYFDFSKVSVKHKTLDDYLDSINEDLKKDICNFYNKKESEELLKDYDKEIYKNLRNISIKKGERFIIIIDEWDYILANEIFTLEERKYYLWFLKNLVKTQGYVAFVYMTGILPIAKNLNQSTLNCFDEYSMLDDSEYYEYFGFTEPEVRQLCEENKSSNKGKSLNYEDLESWYNGYKGYNGEKIFNPWSIGHALKGNVIKNYWSKTGWLDEVAYVINFGIAGVEEDIYQLMKRKEISIELEEFGAENLINEHENVETENDQNEINENDFNDVMKKDLYSKMVAFGFLTYHKGKLSIPNQELIETFAKSILMVKKKTDFITDFLKTSKIMLEATLNKNTERMCEILKDSHNKKIRAGDKMDHGNLKRVIDYAFFYANISYDIHEEESSGDGVADFIFYPKNENGTNIIIELKTNVSAENAIKQIHEKRYYQKIKEKKYRGKVLLVGISYNKENKIYDCKVEEYTNVSEIKSKKSKEEGKNKRKIEDDSNNMRKKLRSYTKVLEIESKEKEKNKRKNEDNSNNMRKKLRSYTKKNDKKK